MPPKRGPRKINTAAASPSPDPQRSPPPDASDEEDGEPTKKIPEELVARILHEFFKREDTRVSRAASKALGRYFEIFVQEAIARTKQERSGRFLEVSLFVNVPRLSLHLRPSLVLGEERRRGSLAGALANGRA